MGKIIMLTSINGTVMYVNSNCIRIFTVYDGDDYTTIIFDIADFHLLKVKETPEEIMKLINGEE